MKEKRAAELRAAWGGAECEHPTLARLYDDTGERSGSYVCTTCGKVLSFREKVELQSSRRQ